jgi:hypothetical protein
MPIPPTEIELTEEAEKYSPEDPSAPRPEGGFTRLTFQCSVVRASKTK